MGLNQIRWERQSLACGFLTFFLGFLFLFQTQRVLPCSASACVIGTWPTPLLRLSPAGRELGRSEAAQVNGPAPAVGGTCWPWGRGQCPLLTLVLHCLFSDKTSVVPFSVGLCRFVLGDFDVWCSGQTCSGLHSWW